MGQGAQVYCSTEDKAVEHLEGIVLTVHVNKTEYNFADNWNTDTREDDRWFVHTYDYNIIMVYY